MNYLFVDELMSQSRRILIVEDNDSNRQLLEDYLISCGYELSSIDGGSNFFQTIAEFQPQLILLDLKLPDVDGFTLLQQLQERPEGQHISVIVVSAFAFKAEQQRALNLGAKRYFIKPVSLFALLQTIQSEFHEREL